MFRRTKIRILKSLMLPVLLYDYGTRAWSSDLKGQVDDFGNKCMNVESWNIAGMTVTPATTPWDWTQDRSVYSGFTFTYTVSERQLERKVCMEDWQEKIRCWVDKVTRPLGKCLYWLNDWFNEVDTQNPGSAGGETDKTTRMVRVWTEKEHTVEILKVRCSKFWETMQC